MKKIKKKHGDIAFEDKGKGNPLVLLRGLGRSSQFWLGFDEELAKKHRIITIDGRGIGQTTVKQKMHHSLFDLADDVITVLDHLSLPSASLFGSSLGGMVAMATALKHEHRISRMILANSSIANRQVMRMTPKAMITLLRGSLLRRDLTYRLADVLLSPTMTDRKRQYVAQRWFELAKEEQVPIMTILFQLLAAARFSPGKQLSHLMTPTLILMASQDQFVPPANSINLHRALPNSHLIAIRGGHELTDDSREQVLMAMEGFMPEGKKPPKFPPFAKPADVIQLKTPTA